MFKKFHKIFSAFIVLSLLTACQSDLTPDPDITVTEDSVFFDTSEVTDSDIDTEITDNEDYSNIEQDWNLKTDKSFVPIDRLCNIDKIHTDTDGFNKYGKLELIDGKDFFFSQYTEGRYFYEQMKKEPVEKATVTVYDSEKGEYRTVLSEAPKDDEHGLSFDTAAVYDSYAYYFRSDLKTFAQFPEERSLWRVSLDDGSTEKLFTFENNVFVPKLIRVNDYLYFDDLCNAELSTDGQIGVIYRCDMNTGVTSVFRFNADNPLPYKNGIIYLHNDGYYYHGDSPEVKGKGIFYKEDELLFYLESINDDIKITGVNSVNDTVIYTYNIYEGNNAAGTVLGVFDQDFERMNIGSTPPPLWSIHAPFCLMSDSGLIAVQRGSQPLIYDSVNDCFFEIFIDGCSHYSAYAAEEGLYFLAYGEEGSSDPVSLYFVTRK